MESYFIQKNVSALLFTAASRRMHSRFLWPQATVANRDNISQVPRVLKLNEPSVNVNFEAVIKWVGKGWVSK